MRDWSHQKHAPPGREERSGWIRPQPRGEINSNVERPTPGFERQSAERLSMPFLTSTLDVGSWTFAFISPVESCQKTGKSADINEESHKTRK
jgi:hypothetical protein